MLTPSTVALGDDLIFSRLRTNASRPQLLKPSRLIIAWSSIIRKMRLPGLPSCGLGVTVPSSMDPNPMPARAGKAKPSLSNPAARPTGFWNWVPSALTGRAGTRSPTSNSSKTVSLPLSEILLSSRIASLCEDSSSIRMRAGRISLCREIIRNSRPFPVGAICRTEAAPNGRFRFSLS